MRRFALRLTIAALAMGLGLLAITPTPATAQQPTTGDDNCVEPLNIPPGSMATLVDGLYVRQAPNLSSGIVFYTSIRLDVRVVGGPVCANGLIWWQVERRGQSPLFAGWVASGRPERLYIYVFERPGDADIDCATPLNVPLNEAVGVLDGTRVRSTPNLDGQVLTVAQGGTTAFVLEGPSCGSGYNWWRVQVDVLGVRYEGWIVEGFPGEYLIAANPDAGPESVACGEAKPFGVGDIVILRHDNTPLKALRTAPSQRADLVNSLPSGIQLEVLSAPFCNEGIYWREVRVSAGSTEVTGWIAETVSIGRLIRNDGYPYTAPPR